MPKNKLKTPDWILKGESKKPKKKSEKTAKNLQANFGATKSKTALSRRKQKGFVGFKLRRCPKCNSDDVKVVIGEVGIWQCEKCKWKGKDVKEEELDEEEFMKYLDNKGEKIN